jgi:hypothetical protein
MDAGLVAQVKQTEPAWTMTSDILDRLAESILQLTPTTCRWPIGDPRTPDFRFCMEPHAPGSSYCPEHYAVAFGKVRSKLASPPEL